jgi:hypothetical protein
MLECESGQGAEPVWNKSSQLKRGYECGAGLTGRYLGGQATQQEQRFDARGEDPDQFAGWFEQAMNALLHLRLFGRLCKFMSGNHRGDRSLFSVRLLRSKSWLGDLFDQN